MPYLPENPVPGYSGTAPMTSADLVNSLITYLWSYFIPAYRARGFPYRHTLDVSETIMNTGQAVKVTVGQVMASDVLSDGGTRQLEDLPPLISDVVLNTDRYVAFGVTQLVEAFINQQPTLPALIDAALSGLLNDFEEDITSNLIANVPNANTVGTYGVALTQTNFLAAFGVLVQNFMPQETYYALLAPHANAFNAFSQISTVVFAQERRNGGADFTEESFLVKPADNFDQLIAWNGGLWSNSNLIPTVQTSQISTAISNIAWHPKALAVAVRPMPLPTQGTGAVARNFIDAKTGVAVQALQQWNLNTQSEEIVMKILYGMAPGQNNWSCLMKS